MVRTSVTHSAIASCATFLFLPHFDVICDLLLNRRTATWNLFVKLNYIRFTKREIRYFILVPKLGTRCFSSNILNTRDKGCIVFNQNSGTVETGAKWYSNVLGNILENLRLVKYTKFKPFNLKCQTLQDENKMGQRFPVGGFRTFEYSLRGCPVVRKLWNMMFHSALKISGNVNWKAPIVVALQRTRGAVS